MADIRINSLPTTASASSSDDFLALDGATNGTRKLNAFSPTFGGNLTVSGTTMTLSGSTFGIDMGAKGSANNPFFDFNSSGNNNDFDVRLQAKGGGVGSALGTLTLHATTAATASNAGAFVIGDSGTGTPTAGTAVAIGSGKIFTGSDVSVGGNLTVSGGTIGTAASTNLTLNGGSSGASLVLAQGSSDATALTANVSLYLQKAAASAIVFRNNAAGSYTEAMRIAGTTGNLLIGTTTDGGQKLQVSGTGYFSAGITIGGTSDVGTGGVLWQDAGSPYSTHLSGANLKFETGSNFARTTALTLDSSQNATFEKTVGSALGFRGTKSVVVSSDTTVEIAADSGLGGIYQITVSGSNRVQRVLVSVAAQQYDNAKISVLSNYTYGGQAVLSNFRVTSNAGNTVRALICDVGNRNGASVTVSASAMFDTNGPLTLVSPSTYTTSVTTGYPMSVASGPSASDLTLGGNLTVSGTGTSSIGGPLNVKTATDLNWFQTTGTAGTAVSFRAFNDAKNAFVVGEIEGSTIRINSASGGNLLIGTTTDSGNGKLQLATHTTSAGGIGFGTDLSLSRFSTSGLGINTTASTTGLLAIGNSGVTASGSAGLNLQLAVNDGYLWNRQNGPLYFGTNNTLALTLDSSQNATFAGKLTVQGTAASTYSGTIDVVKAGGGKLLGLSSTNGNSPFLNVGDGVAYGINFGIDSSDSSFPGRINSTDGGLKLQTNSTTRLSIAASTGNAEFSGNIKTAAPSGGTAATWRLGTVASVSPTSPNRTIEVEIGGTTYYIHAKTTNN